MVNITILVMSMLHSTCYFNVIFLSVLAEKKALLSQVSLQVAYTKYKDKTSTILYCSIYCTCSYVQDK